MTDALTGLNDRRHFDGALREEVARAHRDGRPLALVLLDLDKFRRVNEEVGHQRADRVLQSFAQRLGETARSTDLPCRIGGEEFAVVLPGSSLPDANDFVASLNDRLEAEPISPLRQLTVSHGIAELGEGESAEQLLLRADDALYDAKNRPPPRGSAGVREPRRPKPSGGGAVQ